MNTDEAIKSSSSYRYGVEGSDVNPYIRSVVLDICILYDAKRIICIGPNREKLCHDLCKAGYTVLNMESNESSEASFIKLKPTNQSCQSGINDYPHQVRDTSFDMAISIESREHFSELFGLTKFAAQKLHHGGILVLSTPCQGYLRNLLIDMFSRWSRDRGRLPTDRSWSRKHVKMLLASHGFMISELIGVRHSSLQCKEVVWVARKVDRSRDMGDRK